MESSGGSSKKKQGAGAACSGGKPARPHWRHRDPADTSVYVVHPTEFRAVVQQLTGADSSPPAPHQQGGDGGAAPQQTTQPAAGAAGTSNGQQHGTRGEESRSGGSRGKTLGQMHDECMAWANADNTL